jgi:type 1 glutamine amidotransferase
MRLIGFALISILGMAVAGSLGAQPPAKKKLLFIGQTKGYQHDSVSNAAGTLWKLGHETGLWDTYIKTDCQLVTKKRLEGNAKNLNFFDAVAFCTSGELDMDDSQKADLLSFVRDDGKGFIAIHAGSDTFYKWPEYGDMVGGYFDEHPWGTFDAPLVVEDPGFPGMQFLPKAFTMRDEIYQIKQFSREKVRVLLKLDASKLDLTNPKVHRSDKDFAVIWARPYGKGRVMYDGLGHVEAVWDRSDIQKMYIEHIKWLMGMIPGDATPRPMPAN